MLSLKGILELIKDIDNQGSGWKLDRNILRWRGVYYDMSLHVDGACPRYSLGSKTYAPTNFFGEAYQRIFDERLFAVHPRESPEMRQWRLSQYKPFTQQPFLQIIQVLLGAIFQDSGYSINVRNSADNDYIWGNNFEGKNLVGYIASRFQNIVVDPNGLFVVIPREPGFKTTTDRVEPEILWIPSRFVLWRTEDEILFLLDDIYWCVNSFGYFRFRKDETEGIVNIDGSRSYYGHYLLRRPHHVAGGIWNTQGFYESWLHSGKAWADEFVSSKSAEQLVNKDASHPYTIEASVQCPECEGLAEYQACTICHTNSKIGCGCEDKGYERRQCGCKTGIVSRNPGDRLIATIEDISKGDLIKIVNPDTGINTFHAKNNADMFNALYRALYMNYIEQAQSGVAKDKDMEAKHLFILGISNDLFDRLIPGLLNDILALRNIRVEDGVNRPYTPEYEIVKPTKFQIQTSLDLLEEYQAAKTAGVPNYVLAKQTEDYVDKQFGGDDILKKKTWFINQRDPMALLSVSDKSTLVEKGIFTVQDWQLSEKLPVMVDALIRLKSTEWFAQASYDEIDKSLK